jgi:hypothetical protein
MIAAFQSIFDRPSFMEWITAMRTAIFESDYRAVPFPKEDDGLLQ